MSRISIWPKIWVVFCKTESNQNVHHYQTEELVALVANSRWALAFTIRKTYNQTSLPTWSCLSLSFADPSKKRENINPCALRLWFPTFSNPEWKEIKEKKSTQLKVERLSIISGFLSLSLFTTVRLKTTSRVQRD